MIAIFCSPATDQVASDKVERMWVVARTGNLSRYDFCFCLFGATVNVTEKLTRRKSQLLFPFALYIFDVKAKRKRQATKRERENDETLLLSLSYVVVNIFVTKQLLKKTEVKHTETGWLLIWVK